MNKTITKKVLLIVLNVCLTGFLVAVLAGAGLVLYYLKDTPALTEEALTSTTSSKIYDKDGNLIADLGAEKRDNAETSEIPTDLVNAIVAIEDQRFFNHRGVDVIRIAGALFSNLTSDGLQGGSTLDQQFIKLTYFSTSTEDQTIKRKVQEAYLALQLESKYTKQEILTYYINKVYMSNGNYGMKTAAASYYGKDLKDLSLAQVALLAGMPQAPNQYDPYTQPEAAKNRRDTVLEEMLEQEYITQDQYDEAVATPVTDGLQSLTNTSSYPAYMDNYLKEVISEVEEETGYNLLTTGMDVYTNVDTAAQEYLWNIYNTDQYVTYPDDSFQVASTVVDVTNGKVIAQLGSRNQSSNVSLGTNQAVETNRDFGSTMKPITDYAPALENGIYNSTADTVLDAPYYYPGTTIAVNNWDSSYYGNLTIQSALMYSRNVPAVKTLEAVGLDNALTFLNGLGIDYPTLQYSNAISSNTSETGNQYGASSEKMAAAYAAFANGGIYYEPQYVNKVVYSDGTTQEFTNEGVRAMSEETAFMMTAMLKTVLTYAWGANAAIYGVPQAGKTGTSNYSDEEYQTVIELHPEVAYVSDAPVPDENYVGYTTKYAMAVWTGYSNRTQPILSDGMGVATDVYREMMTYLNPVETATDWEMPDGLYQYGNYYYLASATQNYTYSYSYSDSSSTSETSTSDTSSYSQSSNEEPTETSTEAPATSSTDPAASSTDTVTP